MGLTIYYTISGALSDRDRRELERVALSEGCEGFPFWDSIDQERQLASGSTKIEYSEDPAADELAIYQALRALEEKGLAVEVYDDFRSEAESVSVRLHRMEHGADIEKLRDEIIEIGLVVCDEIIDMPPHVRKSQDETLMRSFSKTREIIARGVDGDRAARRAAALEAGFLYFDYHALDLWVPDLADWSCSVSKLESRLNRLAETEAKTPEGSSFRPRWG